MAHFFSLAALRLFDHTFVNDWRNHFVLIYMTIISSYYTGQNEKISQNLLNFLQFS